MGVGRTGNKDYIAHSALSVDLLVDAAHRRLPWPRRVANSAPQAHLHRAEWSVEEAKMVVAAEEGTSQGCSTTAGTSEDVAHALIPRPRLQRQACRLPSQQPRCCLPAPQQMDEMFEEY